MLNKNQKLRTDQKGIASLVIVILIMFLLTLIVLAMTRNTNQQQRQALDRQLNSQAFYAAESGVNDAFHYLANTPGVADTKEDCEPHPDADTGDYFPGGIKNQVVMRLNIPVYFMT